MSTRSLEALLRPEHVAVIGAGAEQSSLGHIVLRNIVDAGFEGVVYPVNPSHQSIAGIQAYASIAATPVTPELAIICVPAPGVPQVLGECARAGVGAVAVITAGFREVGPEGALLEGRLANELSGFPGLRLLGPNCLGLIAPRISLNASFASAMPTDGHVALVSQSGALATSVIDWAIAEQIGFSYVISLGNMLDISAADVIDFLNADGQTRSIILYVESIIQPRRFMSAARAFALNRPIIVHKAGRFNASAQAAVSHTGALAGEDDVYAAAFRRAGLVRVERVEDVFATAELLARERTVHDGRLAIVTNAGGPGVMAADALIARSGTLARLSPGTLTALDSALPASWSHANPIDVLGDAPPERFAAAVEAALVDNGVDAVLVILTPQAMTDPTASAQAVIEARAKHSHGELRKPLLAAWMGAGSVREAMARLTDAGVAAYAYPEQAVGAFMDLVSYARNLQTLYETPHTVPSGFDLDRAHARQLTARLFAEDQPILTELATKQLLSAYGIPVTQPQPARSAEQAAAIAEQIGYPVALKVHSPEITHKSDLGGVELGLGDAGAVRAAFDRIVAAAAPRQPGAGPQELTVQPMAPDGGIELVLGARRDPSFGMVILVGAGGIATEVLDDRALELPPLNDLLARRMLRSLRIWPLLNGHRGRPGVDIDSLVELLMRFSYLVADYPELVEIEINPLLASAEGTLALDARALLDRELVAHPPQPYSHLAISPYPEQYTEQASTRDGLRVTMRPIRPEDEPRWHEMLDACSPESIHSRFRALVKHTHQLATRFCFIDYDRELAIVAELHGSAAIDGRLAGVVRLVADQEHSRAEYAALVADPWQGHGLSELLTDFGLKVAAQWGLGSVYAETTPDNARMIAVLRKHGFTLKRRLQDGVVFGERAL